MNDETKTHFHQYGAVPIRLKLSITEIKINEYCKESKRLRRSNKFGKDLLKIYF